MSPLNLLLIIVLFAPAVPMIVRLRHCAAESCLRLGFGLFSGFLPFLLVFLPFCQWWSVETPQRCQTGSLPAKIFLRLGFRMLCGFLPFLLVFLPFYQWRVVDWQKDHCIARLERFLPKSSSTSSFGQICSFLPYLLARLPFYQRGLAEYACI
ncbi:MAG: hypothetical protein IAB19_01685 [Proteobacteria bacterium]|uniref:Uncharacterized protein n=1 Tax=Candidatus Avisuccinivibrio stercorigallinarum TaxID=2840704 RepID=A0A9D9DAW6_9GAMM|nr:hypothetical protein [Candidatus Avisuccinivibrio stercorigallinarum]